MGNSHLDKFGETFIHEVRDLAIAHWKNILHGQMKSRESKRIYKELTADQRIAFEAVVPRIVDTALHYILCWMEFHSEDGANDVRVSASDGQSWVQNIVAQSDGLAGELYTSEGWIARFSEYPVNEL